MSRYTQSGDFITYGDYLLYIFKFKLSCKSYLCTFSLDLKELYQVLSLVFIDRISIDLSIDVFIDGLR